MEEWKTPTHYRGKKVPEYGQRVNAKHYNGELYDGYFVLDSDSQPTLLLHDPESYFDTPVYPWWMFKSWLLHIEQ